VSVPPEGSTHSPSMKFFRVPTSVWIAATIVSSFRKRKSRLGR
jgi:hypothetical protein